jgi:hypothetical protein
MRRRDALNIGMVSIEELGDAAEDVPANGVRRELYIPDGADKFDYRRGKPHAQRMQCLVVIAVI